MNLHKERKEAIQMRALSIKQPWLHCILNYGKRVENRTWAPPSGLIGRRIALHASKRKSARDFRLASQLTGRPLEEIDALCPMPRGAIIATATLYGYFDTRSNETRSVNAGGRDWRLDRWWVGPIGLLLCDVHVLPTPVPCRGNLGFWIIPPDIVELIQERACAHVKGDRR